ncbi:MAG: hypothetical protein RBS57_15875 [Desulforhabdus sp.]|jgi:hypothetical protein|nr:hypothetical protein [Desulforhabdus sp.]
MHRQTPLFSKNRLILALAGALVLTGCAANPMHRVMDRVTNLGLDYPDKMTKHIVYATATQSGFIGDFHRVFRNTAYVHGGIEYNSDEYQYRHSTLILPNLDSSWLGANVVAVLPDSVPNVVENDIVVLKMYGAADRVNANFHQNKQGNIVLGIVCFADRPDYENCKRSLPGYAGHPSNARNRFGGISTIPRYEDNAEYGLSFTPYFDKKTGKVLPTALPVPTRDQYVPPSLPPDSNDSIRKLGERMERIY